MFSNVVPIEELKTMLNVAQEEAKNNFLKVLHASGKIPTTEDMKTIEIASDVAQLFFFSMIKQIDIYEATSASHQTL